MVAAKPKAGSGAGSRSVRLGDSKRIPNVENALFDLFKNEQNKVPINKFFLALETTGLQKNDPRLKETLVNLERVATEETEKEGEPVSIENLHLDRDTFKSVVSYNIVLISKAFRQQFVIPEFIHFTKHIEDCFRKCKGIKDGKNASYIPQLAKMNSDYWGISLCTVDGQRFSLGDVTVPFTMQSTSKVLTYVVAHSELGSEKIHKYVGQEPSGRMFNELVLDHNRKPHNPMINAGAILTASLLQTIVRAEMKHSEKFDWLMNYFKRLAGGQAIGFNNAVFMSEREDADRNYALAYYMRENHCFPSGTDLNACLDLYFQTCSMEVTCETMAVIAGTLANGGICPTTGEQVLDGTSVRDALSIMHSCGMYDYSGQFAFKVGLPAKSGVSGAIMVVVPNVMGFCTFAPPLDHYGNSVKGVQFCKEVVKIFNFHRYDNLKHAENKKDPRRHKYEAKGLDVVALLFSAAAGDVSAMRRYHLSGMDMSQSDYDGRTALHLAAAEGHLECVEFLLKNCACSPKSKDRWGRTPVDDARCFGHESVANALLDWLQKMERINEEEHNHGKNLDSPIFDEVVPFRRLSTNVPPTKQVNGPDNTLSSSSSLTSLHVITHMTPCNSPPSPSSPRGLGEKTVSNPNFNVQIIPEPTHTVANIKATLLAVAAKQEKPRNDAVNGDILKMAGNNEVLNNGSQQPRNDEEIQVGA